MTSDHKIEITIDNTAVAPSLDTIKAMAQFLKDGTIPITYLGDIATSVDFSSLANFSVRLSPDMKRRTLKTNEVAEMDCPYAPEPGY